MHEMLNCKLETLNYLKLLKIKILSSSSLKYLTFKKLRIIKNVITGQTRVFKNKTSYFQFQEWKIG